MSRRDRGGMTLPILLALLLLLSLSGVILAARAR